jgi:uroporphyrinogen-III synthase
MKDREIRILSTRTLDGALIETAAYQHIVIDTISFIEIKKQVTPAVARRIEVLAEQQANVVFTSVNAVEATVEVIPVHPLMPDWNIYCIGGATFTLIKKYWPYERVLYTAKNATELAQKMVADQLERLVFFCGNKRLEELPALLHNQNIEVEELVLYETIETPQYVDQAYDGVLFFSPSGVSSFFSKNKPDPHAVLFAIGNTTANAIKQCSKNDIIVSDFPAKDQVVDKAIKYFAKNKIDVKRF